MKMCIYRLMIVVAILCCCHTKAKAQLAPIYSVPGPEVANLGLYGTVPVSHFTGVPDISVPLYTVNAGNISVPVTANYHIAAVKLTSAPSSLGLGWSLRAGGYITRTVRGIYDEKQGTDGIGHGFYDHAYKMKDMTHSDFDTHTQNIVDNGETSYYELSADEFNFNFCGYSGTFYYNEHGGWTVVSDDDIKVEFNPQTDFVNLQQLASRITNINLWSQQPYNNRFFCHFTLTTPDGCRYEFGSPNGSSVDAMEFCIPYYSRNNSDLIASSWHLSKITTPDNQTVTFKYDTSALMCDLKYVPQYYLVTNMETIKEVPCQTGRKGYTGFLLFPVNIKSIETVKEKISFYYYPDQAYGQRFNAGCLFWENGTNNIRFDIYRGFLDEPYNQFHVFMKYSGSESETARNMYSPILHRMAISNKCGGKSRSIYFDYAYNNIRKLSLITHREGIPDIITKTEQYPHNIVLTRYEIPQNQSATDMPEYHFVYDTTATIPSKYVYADTDSWGYYNGQNVSLTAIPAFEKKNPLTYYTKSEVLKSVIYPTGGNTSFEYEQNSFSKQVDGDRSSVVDKIGTSGGLRIKSITSHDSNGKIISSKKYYYSETRSANGKSSGISKGEPCFRIEYTIKQKISNNEYPKISIASEGGYFPSVTNCNTPDVGYSCVIEETLDADGNSLGYIKYRYSNFDTDIFSCRHMDIPYYYAYNITGTNATTPYSDFSFERGKLLSKEYYDSNDRCVRKETIRYRTTQHPSFTTATQEFMQLGTAYTPYMVKFGWLTKTGTCSYLPVATDVVEYSSKGSSAYTESLRHSYNSYRLPSCDSLLMSNGKWQVTQYEYPFSLTQHSQYQKMTDLHIINPVVKKTVTAGGRSRAETNNYELAGSTPYVSKRTVGANGMVRTEYEVTKTDAYGNPIEIIENGTTSVLVWGGYGRKLIARYVNATYKQLRYALNVDVENYSICSINTINYSQLENIRSLMPFALSYIYKYNGNMQLISQTDANGFTTYYNYDMFDRLRETFFYNDKESPVRKSMMNRYDYHYYNAE